LRGVLVRRGLESSFSVRELVTNAAGEWISRQSCAFLDFDRLENSLGEGEIAIAKTDGGRSVRFAAHSPAYIENFHEIQVHPDALRGYLDKIIRAHSFCQRALIEVFLDFIDCAAGFLVAQRRKQIVIKDYGKALFLALFLVDFRLLSLYSDIFNYFAEDKKGAESSKPHPYACTL
jgi:hypothetical protein